MEKTGLNPYTLQRSFRILCFSSSFFIISLGFFILFGVLILNWPFHFWLIAAPIGGGFWFLYESLQKGGVNLE